MVSGIGSNGKGNLIGELNKNEKEKENLLGKIATGKRINKASDDAAGLAVVSALEAAGVQLSQAVQNNEDATSALNIADGASSQISDGLVRMQELAMESANGTLSDEQRNTNAVEFNALRDELTRTTRTTDFNGQNLIGGDQLTAQVGTDSSSDSQINISGTDLASQLSGLSSLDISTQAGAQSALKPLQDTSDQITKSRGDLGAATSRLQTAKANSESAAVANEGAAANIRDADIAESTAQLTAANIRSQANVAMQAHQKLTANNVLDLLR